MINYFTIDQNPYSGISYYRLKQTDFDGQYKHSEIISSEVENQISSKIQIFPNPTDNIVRIISNETELEEIIVYNIYGQVITSTTLQIIIEDSTKAKINLSELNTGMYFIKTKNTVNKVYKH